MGDRANINASYGGRQSGLDGEAIMASMGGGGISGPTVLATLSLGTPTAATSVVWSSAIIGATGGSSITATSSDGTTLSVTSGVVSGTFLAAGSPTITLVETLAGATGSPKTTTVTLTVSLSVTLSALGLSASLQIGVAASGTISGATSGSTIVANIPGITINSGARTFSGTPTGSPQTIANGLVETLAGAVNSPRSNTIVVSAAGAIPYPQTLFSAGATGLWVQADDAATTFSDSTGATAASADGTVGKWLDKSGGGNHLTTVDAARPTMRTYAPYGNFVQFANNLFFDMPASFTVNRQAMTMFVVMQHQQPAGTFMNSPAAATTTTAFGFVASGSEVRSALRSFTSGNQASGFYASSSMTAYGGIFGAAARKYYLGREAASLSAATAGSATGGFIGRWNTSTSLYLGALVKEIVVIQRELTDAEAASMLDYLSTTYSGVSRTETRFIVTDGDSITQGVGSLQNTPNGPEEWVYCWPAQLTRLYGTSPKLANYGTGGDMLAAMAGTTNTTALTLELNHNTAYAKQVAILAGGTNDLNSNNATLAQLQGWATDWFTNVTSTGNLTKFACTILPRGTFTSANETTRQQYNAWLTGGTSPFGTNIIDNGNDSRLANTSDPTIYRDSVTHPTKLGYSYMAQNAKTKLDATGF